MKIDVLTIFPEMFTAVKSSILGKAEERGILDINLINIRDYTLDKHKKVDDYPFGGGVGMLMQAEPIFRSLEGVGAKVGEIIYMSPKGKKLNKDKVMELSKRERLIILCGHYEGVDQRAIDYWNMEEISIGDYVLTGGEPAAIVLIDAVARMVPKVLGSSLSIEDESVYSGLLEAPQYTKPREFRKMKVPEVLLSGHHKNIELWKFEMALRITKERRPDFFEEFCKKKATLSKEEQKVLKKVIGIV